MAGDLYADLFEQQFRECSDRDPRCSFPGAGAFEYVTQIVRVVFQPARKIGVTGPRSCELSSAFSSANSRG
jgi:hypothetical protein